MTNRDILTKITPPRPLHVLARQRLTRLLEKTGQGVTWISAPAGSGKTTLAAAYAASRKRPCLWYQLDPRDADLSTFFYYLGRSLKRARPRKRMDLPLLTPEYRGRIDLFTRRCFEALFTAMGSRGAERSVLVLDDFQCLEDEAFHDMLRIGLGMVPPGVQVLVLSRTAPPASFAVLRANNMMNVLGWKELRFSFADSAAFFHQLPDGDLFPRETVRLIHDKTQGWAAGLRLLGETLVRTSSLEDVPTFPREGVFDYFLDELFRKTGLHTQEFLLKTALLPSITARDAEAVTGLASSANLLRGLAEQNFFITRHPGQETSYRYHQLFREFLIAHAEAYYPAHRIALIRRDAAAVLRAGGRTEEAVELYLAGNHWADLMGLVQEQAPALLRQGRQEVLRGWLARIPADLVREHPWLLYWSGVAHLPQDTRSGLDLLRGAFEGFVKQGEMEGAMLACAEMIQAIFQERGNFMRMEPFFEWMNDAVGPEPRFSSRAVESRVVMSMVLGCVFCRPDHPHRGKWIDRGQELLAEDIGIDRKICLGFHLQIFHIYMGDMGEAAKIHARLGPLVSPQALPVLIRLYWLVIKAAHNHLVDPNPALCRKIVQEGLELAEATGVHAFDVFLLLVAAYTAIDTGQMTELEQLKSRLGLLMPKANAFDVGNYHCMLACAHLAQGDGEVALIHAELATGVVFQPRTPFPAMLGNIGLAEACIEAGKWNEARSFLRRARRIVAGIAGFQGQAHFLIPVAYAAFRSGRERVGLRVLAKALARARQRGWINALYWRPRQLGLLCAKALENGLEVEYVRMLVHRHNLSPLVPRSLRTGLPYPLRIRTFGQLSVTSNGMELVSVRKGTRKPLTLLKALIVLGGRDVHEETLRNLLWPDTDGDKAAQSLKFTLHALRKFLNRSLTD
ncbi:AAA family ATPase [Desulfonatronum sp. SC1]|uniref:AAA family ATPase n=1 Tax=Desulfonatronum sp. SC1 TaxID=2109626 RepID=UPI000D2FE11A|nr:AAA family ATPase [Desulfonatronum sp. SC1]PTN31277.1 hypothetical protein C6366_18285 [Desulfonatronum sp. SC1]